MEKLAVSLALGAVLGVFPVVGVPTFLCGVVAAVWRLNFPALQLMNYVVYPLQIALLWPFTRFGGALFGVSHHLRGLAGLMTMAFHTAAAWLCFAVPAGLLLYLALRFFLRCQIGRFPKLCRSTNVVSTKTHESHAVLNRQGLIPGADVNMSRLESVKVPGDVR